MIFCLALLSKLVGTPSTVLTYTIEQVIKTQKTYTIKAMVVGETAAATSDPPLVCSGGGVVDDVVVVVSSYPPPKSMGRSASVL